VPIEKSNDPEGQAAVGDAVAEVEAALADALRLRVARREGSRPGEKYAHGELRGVPLRVAVGARDLAEGVVTVVRRVDGEETRGPVDPLALRLPGMLEEAQAAILQRSLGMLEERSREVT